MTHKTDIKLFEDRKVRSAWDDKQEKWYLSVVDVIEVLTESPRPRKYWNALKTKLKAKGNELSQNLGQLKNLKSHPSGEQNIAVMRLAGVFAFL
jgi:hypothetical protein